MTTTNQKMWEKQVRDYLNELEARNKIVVRVVDTLPNFTPLVDDGWMRFDGGDVSSSEHLYWKERVETGEDITIPEKYQMIVNDEFGMDGGDLTVDGELVVLGSEQLAYWDDIQSSLFGRRLSSTSGSVNYNYTENTIDFSSGGSITNTNDTVAWNIQLPHGTKFPSDLRVHIHFEQSDVVVRTMTLRYRIQSNSQAKTTAWTTVTADTTNAIFPYTSGTLINILPIVSIDLTGYSLSDIVQFQMTRTDVNTGLLPVTFADAHVYRDALGSGTEYTK